MAESGKDKIKKQTAEELERIAVISWQIRQAVRNALPAPPEQFFTVMVPGKVVNFKDYSQGFDAQGNPTTAVLPTETELNQAMLCDDMPALGGVQLGPTGRSVANCYDATLSKLIPNGTTIGIDNDEGPLNDDEQRYKKAMVWLTTEDPARTPKTHLDVYIEKQAAYTQAAEDKTKAFDAALQRVANDQLNTTVAMQRAAYDQWVAENQRTYRNLVQAAYMDWVIAGKKEEVEYWFAVVDRDSAMSRVEKSKEAMRASTVSSADGSTDFQKVVLTPSNWAWIAQEKAVTNPDSGKTIEWYTWEIARLQKVNTMLEALKTKPPKFSENPQTVPPTGDKDPKLGTAFSDYLTASSKYQQNARTSTDKDDDAKKKSLEDDFKALEEARGKMTTELAANDKTNLDNLNTAAQNTHDAFFTDLAAKADSQIAENKKKMNDLDQERQGLLQTRIGDPSKAVEKEIGIDDPNTAADTPAPPANPDGTKPVVPETVPDYWTSISVEVSSSYDAQQVDTASNAYSAGASGGWGGFSAGGSVSHADTSSDAAHQLANSSIKVSFDCMRVDIARPWLRPELFYDDDLKCAPNEHISPGPVKLGQLMDPGSYEGSDVVDKKAREEALKQYSLFPMFPTAFLLAANVVLEITGETSDLQSHFKSSTTSASATIGWGPFSISSSYSHSATHASSTCETTASGCRITIKSPQIIGWISEMIPALPRIGLQKAVSGNRRFEETQKRLDNALYQLDVKHKELAETQTQLQQLQNQGNNNNGGGGGDKPSIVTPSKPTPTG